MKLRFAEPKEITAIYRMYSDYQGVEMASIGLKFDAVRLMQEVEDMVKSKAVLVGESDGKMIGAVAGYLIPSGCTPDVFFQTKFFYVCPEYRHKTPQFIRELMEFLKSTPATKLIIASPSYAPEGLNRFFKINGGVEVERHFMWPVEREVVHA